jgi:hypothetical protein
VTQKKSPRLAGAGDNSGITVVGEIENNRSRAKSKPDLLPQRHSCQSIRNPRHGARQPRLAAIAVRLMRAATRATFH